MVQKCELVEIPATPTLSIRLITRAEDLPPLIGQSYGTIMQYMNTLGEAMAGEPFVIYHNLDMQNLDVELGIPVSRSLPPQGDIQPSSLPAGPAAHTVYTGPYETMEPAYGELSKFISDIGREPTGIAIEYYLTGPETPPDKHRTRIVFPLKK